MRSFRRLRKLMTVPRLVVLFVAVAALAAGTLSAVHVTGPSGTGSAGILSQGSQGSQGSPSQALPWWDPRGWFSSGSHAPASREVPGSQTALLARPNVVRQAVAPPERRVRELTSMRSEFSRTFLLSDGRRQAVISGGPVNYRDAAGRWQPISTTVTRSARAGFSYQDTANVFGSFFSSDPAALVRFELPSGGWLQTGLAGARRVAPRVSGNTVSYPGILPGLTLEYAVSPQSLKERIVLASASADVAGLRFTVRAGGGLVPRAMPGGATGWYDGPALMLVSPAPFMTDARTDRSTPLGHPWSPVAQNMSWDAARSAQTVTLAPSGTWLSAAGRAWPVTVDPTITIAPVPCQSYNPDNPANCAHNVMISSDSPTTNFNSSTSWPLPVGTTATGEDRGLIQFPLGAIPSGSSIDSADLNLYWDDSFTASTAATQPPQTVQAYQATTAWNPTTVTWNSNIGLGTEGMNRVTVTATSAGTTAKGAWPSQASTSAANGSSYRYDQDTTAGDTFTFVPALTEAGSYQVQDHYVASTTASTAAPVTVNHQGGSASFTVNQASGTGGVWATLGNETFAAGTAGSAVVGDGPASATVRVEADGVRFTKFAQVTDASAPPGQGLEGDRWDSFAVRNIVQNWVSGQANDGFVLKAASESTKSVGGPEYERSGFYYNGETVVYPQLVVTYGQLTSVTFKPITVIRDNGANLSWTPYVNSTGDPGKNLAEYQVHRSVFQSFTPSASTLVAPVPAGTTSFDDTTSVPAPPGASLGNAFYYMIAVKTADGTIVPGPVQLVRLPLGGQTTVIVPANGAATLSSGQPTENLQSLFGFPWLETGNNGGTGCSTCYGVARSVFTFPSVSALIPAGTHILDGELKLWGMTNNPGGAPSAANYQAHNITQAFTPSQVTWNSAATGTAWTTAGGTIGAATDTGVSGLTNDPDRQEFTVTSAVQGWVTTPSSQHGLMIKVQNEASTAPQDQELWLSPGAAEPALAPALVITYTDPTSQTYEAPATPKVSAAKSTYTTQVTVANPTSAAWGTNMQLGYHWVANDGTTLVSTPVAPVYTPLPATLNPGSQATLTETVATPDTVTGDTGTRSGYQLVWDMYNATAKTWLSSGTATPNVSDTAVTSTMDPPAGQVTSVAETAETLGLEKYFQYTPMATGSGSALDNNAANGNVVWNYSPFSNPSTGFRTFVRLDYNSMDTTESSMGFGWSLQASTLTRLGTPLDFHPPGNPTTVTLTDANGGSHVFTLNTTVTPNVWTSPPGFHYYLQQLASCDPTGQAKNNPAQAWQITAPDNTRFLFDCSGYQQAVIDKNGNEADFTYSQRKSSNSPTEFLDYITDPAHRQTLTITYYTKGQSYSYINDDSTFPPTVATGTNLTNPDIVDQIASITDVSGRKISFLYDDQGLMSQMTDGPNTVAADGPVWSGPASTAKVFWFGYDPTQGNKNVKLVSVTDPRNDTTCLYYYPPSASFKWSLQAVTSRRADPASSTGAMAACPATPATAYETQFAYTAVAAGANPLLPNGGVQTTVTDPLSHTTSYLTDTLDRPVQSTDPVGRKTTLAWDSDNNLTTRTENNGAVTSWTWDPNTGYPLTMQDAANQATGKQNVYAYQTSLGGHVAFLTSVTSPLGNITSYGLDAFGNVTSVTAPDGNVPGAAAGSFTANFTYNSDGTMATAKDPDGNITKYGLYDPTGLPLTVTDPRGNTASRTYSLTGEVTSDTDAYGHTVTTTQYDVFGRTGLVTTRKSATQNVYTAAPVYDGNDNVTTSYRPSYSSTTAGAATTSVYNADDQVTSTTTPPDSGTGTGPTTTRAYNNDDTLASVTRPDAATPAAGATAAQYTTAYAYNPDQTVQTITDGLGNQSSYTYDSAGNTYQVTDPDGNTTTTTYDLDHRAQQVTDPNGNYTQTTRDADGRVIQARDKNGNVTLSNYDANGQLIQQQVPVQAPGQQVSYATTQYGYDQAGNRTQVLTPLAVQNGYSLFTTPPSACTTTPVTSPCPFTRVTTYNADNQVATQQTPAGGDGPYSAPQVTSYSYDKNGRQSQVTVPPSNGDLPATGLNTTSYTYWDNGWAATSTDPRGIVTSYDYAPDGQQSSRILTSADGGMTRGMSWSYFPDGKLQQVTDDGVPTGSSTEMVDVGDAAAATGSWATGTCPAAPAQPQPQPGTRPLQPACGGPTYRTHPIAAAGSTTDAFTWHLNVPQSGQYTIYVKYPALPAGTTAATGATYTITTNGDSSGGGTPVTVTGIDQTQNAGTSSGGTWVKLGEWQFNQTGTGQQVTLNPAGSTGAAGSVVVASAVEAVRDTTGITNSAVHGDSYSYDLDGNTTGITGTAGTGTGNTAVTIAVTLDVLDRTSSVTETWASGPVNTTSYTYDAVSNIKTLTHTITQGGTTTTDQNGAYTWNNLNQLANETDGPTTGDATQKTTAFTYTPAGQVQTQQQPNGNLITDSYTAAGQVYTKAECTNNTSPVIPAYPIISPTAITCGSGGQLVAADAYTYDANGEQTQDLSNLMSADSSGTYMSHTWNYAYNPLGQLTQVSDGSTQTEAYQHDPVGNIISQTIGNTSAPGTTSTYSRGLLQSSTTSGQTSTYNYDPLGRLDTVTGPDGSIQQSSTYDGFDNLASTTQGSGSSATTTSYTYDPLNRVTSETTGNNTTSYSYLGMTSQVSMENDPGSVTKTYGYSPGGTRLFQTSAGNTTTPNLNGTAYYSYNTHSDVEALTGPTGTPTATYGYTAYGSPVASMSTGADKNNTSPGPNVVPYDSYRFNAMQWDPGSGQYNMGFRNYDAGTGSFTTRDMYAGAGADMALTGDPFSGGAYAFGDANPISNIEVDGHMIDAGNGCIGGLQAVIACSQRQEQEQAGQQLITRLLHMAQVWQTYSGPNNCGSLKGAQAQNCSDSQTWISLAYLAGNTPASKRTPFEQWILDVTGKLDAVHDDPVGDAVIQTLLTAGIGSLARVGVGALSGLIDILGSSAAEDAGIGAGSGPWAEGVKAAAGRAVGQITGGSCVAACGEMLSGGSISQMELLSEIGEWSNPAALARALGKGWTGGYFGSGEDALAAAESGPMGAALRVGTNAGHMVVTNPLGEGRFLVLDPWNGGSAYEVGSQWIEQYVEGGTFR